MSPKRLSIVVVIILGLLIVSLLIPNENTIQIMTMPKAYSFYQTSPADSFVVPIFTTNPTHNMWNQEKVVSANIHSDDESISMDVKAINNSENKVFMKEDNWTVVYVELQPSIQTTTNFIEYPNPTLELIYPTLHVEIPLGSFGFFAASNTNHLALSSLSATHEEIHGLETISGIGVALYNKTSTPLTITSYRILGSAPAMNPFYSKALEHTNIQDMNVNDIVQEESYDPSQTVYSEWEPYTINPNQESALYIPLSYQKELLAHRISICVTYEISAVPYDYCIDDFPFIESADFLESYIPYFQKGQIIYDSNQ